MLIYFYTMLSSHPNFCANNCNCSTALVTLEPAYIICVVCVWGGGGGGKICQSFKQYV